MSQPAGNPSRLTVLECVGVVGVGVGALFAATPQVQGGWARWSLAALIVVTTLSVCAALLTAGAAAKVLLCVAVLTLAGAVALPLIPALSSPPAQASSPQPATAPPSSDPEAATVTAAERIQACTSQHHMDKARDRTETDLSTGEVDTDTLAQVLEREDLYSRAVYRECTWPPKPGSSPDGYSSITELVTLGPGPGEATNDDVLHRITATCDRLRLAWTYGSQGSSEHLPAYEAKIGDLIQAWDGHPYRPGRVETQGDFSYTYPPVYPYPKTTELIAVSNGKIALDDAHCVG